MRSRTSKVTRVKIIRPPSTSRPTGAAGLIFARSGCAGLAAGSEAELSASCPASRCGGSTAGGCDAFAASIRGADVPFLFQDALQLHDPTLDDGVGSPHHLAEAGRHHHGIIGKCRNADCGQQAGGGKGEDGQGSHRVFSQDDRRQCDTAVDIFASTGRSNRAAKPTEESGSASVHTMRSRRIPVNGNNPSRNSIISPCARPGSASSSAGFHTRIDDAYRDAGVALCNLDKVPGVDRNPVVPGE
jgi:hypothetical protein